ncbi:MAG: catechol 1,2-dioxygenase, partial [Chloroflexota bacterium]
MGEIVFAAVVAHVPPIVANQSLRDFLSPDHPTTLIDGMHQMREKIDASGADTFFIIDTHWLTTSHH